MALPNTHFGAERIGAWLSEAKKIFFAGIGGVSMNSLAHISKLRGYTVCGYDRTPSPLTKQLEQIGITVWYETDASHVQDADMLVYTVAIPATLPEYAEAIRRGIPVVSRADYLGYIMSGYDRRIGVSGMHGKSTTTAMLECIFRVAGCDPTVSCGAPMKDADNRCDRIGGEKYFIFEACEYMDSFLDFYPTDAVVLNIEMDHPDYFRDLAQIESSFKSFMARTGASGTVYLNAGDENVMRAAEGYPGHAVTFGMDHTGADYNATEIYFSNGLPSFVIKKGNDILCRVRMLVPGTHSVCDAVAAAAVALECGISPSLVEEGLAQFAGASRRMDYRGKTQSGAQVYDDYAHHPTEIAATLKAALDMQPNRLWCVFQPHTYSRTKELFDDFAEALAAKGVTEVLIADIYTARETDSLGMSSALLAEAVRANGAVCRAVPDTEETISYLLEKCTEGDMILVMGAGDIGLLCPKLVSEKKL